MLGGVAQAARWLRRLVGRRPAAPGPPAPTTALVTAARAEALCAVVTALLIKVCTGADPAAVVAELRVLSAALLALSDQLAAEDRVRGSHTAWAEEATALAGFARAALDVGAHPPVALPVALPATLQGLGSGLDALHARMVMREWCARAVARR